MATLGLGELSVGALLALAMQAAPAAAQELDGDGAREATEHIIVSARKRDETLLDVPVAISSFSPTTISDYRIHSFIDYASRTPGMSFAYGNGSTAGNPGTAFGDARTIAIRGVAGARTTGIYLDDTPLPGALDVRVLDLQGIEILKGPQGTLYGEGSLGGNVRLISNAPNLQKNSGYARLTAGFTADAGGGNKGAEAVANIVLSEGRLALRLVGAADDQSGYLTRHFPSNIADPASAPVSVGHQGALRSIGGSITALLRATPALDLTLRLAYQNQYHNGFPATYAPLPAFEPVFNSARDTDVQPVAHDLWTLPSLTLAWHGDTWKLVSSTSYFERRVRDLEDSTEGTAAYWGSTIIQPYAWSATHRSTELAHETRIAFKTGGAIEGTAGVFYSRHRAQFGIDDIYAQLGATIGAPSLIWKQKDVNVQNDAALFAEIDYRFAERMTLTAGARRYLLRQSDDISFAYLSTTFHSANDNRASGTSPKAALSYRMGNSGLLYLSAAKGFRQGNAQLDPTGFGCDTSLAAIGQTPSSMTRIAPDSLWSYEAGFKVDFPDPGLLLTGALYRIKWDNIQQPIFLSSCGFYLQGNAGAATIDGAEFELAGRVAPGLKLRAALGYTDARITADGNTGQAVGSPVFNVPKVSASIGVVTEFPISARFNGFFVADYSYSGKSLSANSGADMRLERAAYCLANLRSGVRWDGSELSLGVKNLGNEKPNLGDIGYIGYQRYVPGTTTPMPQVVTVAPRTITLEYQARF
jgi:iron complex outermembrane receptor protein